MLPLTQKSAHLNLCGQVSRFFLCVFFCTLTTLAIGQWKQIHSFEKEWMVYQPAVKGFLPYISTKHFGYKSKSIALNPADYPEGYLRVKSETDYHLFIQGTFQRFLPKGVEVRLTLDSLQKKYPGEQQLVLTIYNNDLKGLPKELSIERKIEVNSVAMADFLSIKRRDSFLFYQFFGFSFVILLLFIGTLFASFPRYFQTYFRFSDWIHWEVKEDAVLKSPFAFPNLWVIFTLSLLTAFISFYNRISHQAGDTLYESWENFQTVGSSFVFLVTKVFVGFVLFISRYFMFKLFTNLFRLSQVAEAHYFKSLQTNFQFFTLLFVCISLYSLYQGPLVPIKLSYISYLITGYFVVRSVFLFQVLRRSFPVNQMSLLAYLVLMEGQVLVFGLRELIFPEYM
ncbi:MAG: hypothetical protein RL127_116 [Bacteroidota bacterium]